MKTIEITKVKAYNQRRYGKPWVGVINHKNLKYEFPSGLGVYSGDDMGGILYIRDPLPKQIYCYGQKDYRGNNSIIKFFYFNEKWEKIEVEKSKIVETIKSF